jgi:hypothetical protein
MSRSSRLPDVKGAAAELRSQSYLTGQAMLLDRHTQAINEVQFIFARRRQNCLGRFIDPSQASATCCIAPAIPINATHHVGPGDQHQGVTDFRSDLMGFSRCFNVLELYVGGCVQCLSHVDFPDKKWEAVQIEGDL